MRYYLLVILVSGTCECSLQAPGKPVRRVAAPPRPQRETASERLRRWAGSLLVPLIRFLQAHAAPSPQPQADAADTPASDERREKQVDDDAAVDGGSTDETASGRELRASVASIHKLSTDALGVMASVARNGELSVRPDSAAQISPCMYLCFRGARLHLPYCAVRYQWNQYKSRCWIILWMRSLPQSAALLILH